MLHARGDEADRIVGLEIGADDYLPKTFSTRELLAAPRRHPPQFRPPRQAGRCPAEPPRRPAPHEPRRRVVTLDDKPLDVTPVEFDLLACLMRARGRVKSREAILEEIRDRNYEVFDARSTSYFRPA